MYKIKKIRYGWIVINKSTGAHAHFNNWYGCKCIVCFLRKGIVPENPYLQESYRRLTVQPNLKPKYRNRAMRLSM